MANYVKFRQGTPQGFQVLLENNAVESDTLYFIYEQEENSAELYLGTRKISGDENSSVLTSLKDLQDIVIQNVADKDLLVYEGNKWVNKTVEEVFANYINTLSSTIVSIEKIDDNTHQALIDNEFAEKDPKVNDIVIIKELIGNKKYQHTGYVFNGENWTALDGNYNANNIYFDNDFIFTENIGTVQIPEGQGNISVEAEGKNLKEFLATLFAEEKNPEVTNPSATISLGSATTTYEVGETYTPNYTITFNSGKYSYGPNPTGVSPISYSVIDSRGNETTEAKGSFDDILITDDTDYKITAKVNYSEGNIPLTNLGNEAVNYKIQAGELNSISTNTVKGYRKSFYGTLNHKDDYNIRDLAKSSNKSLENGSSFVINIPAGALRTIIAYPATLRNMIEVLDKNDSNSNIVSSFLEPEIIQVAGANGYEPIDYKVYTLPYANPYSVSNVYTVTI